MDELLALGRARRQAGHKTSEWSEQKNKRMLERMDKVRPARDEEWSVRCGEG